jgi:hypothetical protein
MVTSFIVRIVSVLAVGFGPSDDSTCAMLEVSPSKQMMADESYFYITRGPLDANGALRVGIGRVENRYWILVEKHSFWSRLGSFKFESSYSIGLHKLNGQLDTYFHYIYSIDWVDAKSFEVEGSAGVLLVSLIEPGKFKIEMQAKRYESLPDSFTLLIPMDWKPIEGRGLHLTHFVTPKDRHLTFDVRHLEPHTGMSLEEILESWMPSLKDPNNRYDLDSIHRTQINGYPAIEVVSKPSESYRQLLVFLRSGKEIYLFLLEINGHSERDVRKVLSTFESSV